MTVPVPAVGDQATASWADTVAGDLNTIDTNAWTAYTPTLTAVTTNPNLGSTGSVLGRYCTVGKFTSVYIHIILNGTGVSAGSGQFIVSLPVSPQGGFGLGAHLIGWGQIKCAGVFTLVQVNTDGKLRYFTAAVGGTQTIVTNAVPGTWVAGDFMELWLTYEAA